MEVAHLDKRKRAFFNRGITLIHKYMLRKQGIIHMLPLDSDWSFFSCGIPPCVTPRGTPPTPRRRPSCITMYQNDFLRTSVFLSFPAWGLVSCAPPQGHTGDLGVHHTQRKCGPRLTPWWGGSCSSKPRILAKHQDETFGLNMTGHRPPRRCLAKPISTIVFYPH